MSISVLTTGGTIASTLRDGRVAPAVRGRDLVDPRAAVDVHEVMAIDLADHDPGADGRDFRNATTAALADPRVEGVVVLHGTDTLEEAAILLDLFHSDPRPVVITGAQRPADDACPDGPGNIAAAIDIARDPNARHRGVLIAFGGQVHRARGTRKAHTTDLDAFESYLPEADEHCRAVLPWRQELIDVRVDIAALYPGADRAHIDASLTAGARGIVLDAMGSGNANRSILAAVADCVDRDVAVVVHQSGSARPRAPRVRRQRWGTGPRRRRCRALACVARRTGAHPARRPVGRGRRSGSNLHRVLRRRGPRNRWSDILAGRYGMSVDVVTPSRHNQTCPIAGQICTAVCGRKRSNQWTFASRAICWVLREIPAHAYWGVHTAPRHGELPDHRHRRSPPIRT